MKITVGKDPRPAVLLFFPTLKTPQERMFWTGFSRALVSRGYRPIRISFSRPGEDSSIGVEDVFIPIWRTIDQSPELAHLGDENDPLVQKFFLDPKHSAAFEALMEFARLTTNYSRGSPLLDYQSYRRSGLAYVHYVLTLINELAPAKIIVNNDTHPLHIVARYCADTLGVPAIHSERSPLVNQWFEPKGFYGTSDIKEFLSDGRWKEPGEHEAWGSKAVDMLKTNPAGHRSAETSPVAPKPTFDRRKRRMLLALDHALATGWTLPSHPLRLTNYAIFGSPEEAISFFGDLAERLGLELLVKAHPSEPKNAHFIDVVRHDPRMELAEGGIDEPLRDSDIIVCFLTKVATVGLAHGKAVVTIGDNTAAISGLTYHCNSRGEVEDQIRSALSHGAQPDNDVMIRRFLGYLDRNFFVANDLSNAGAQRLLDRHFKNVKAALESVPQNAGRFSASGGPFAMATATSNGSSDTNPVMNKVAYYPVIDSEEALIDTLSRAAWFLTFSPISKIVIPVKHERLSEIQWRVAPGMDPTIGDRFGTLRSRVEFLFCPTDSDLRAALTSCSTILSWSRAGSEWLFQEEAAKAKWLSGKRVWRVDPKFDRNEGALYIEVSHRFTNDLPAVIERNRKKFMATALSLGRYDRAYLLATGPSAQYYKKLNHDGAFGVVCNSIIINDELMQALKPKFVVFADPIFHFGPSEYAAAFRQTVLRAAEKYDFTIVIPIKYYAIFLSSLPELEERMIAVPFSQGKNFNFDLVDNYDLKVTANILTFLMVPLASTFASKIEILGCDGRPIEENSYFWSHNPSTQINSKMANIRDVHPGFFAIDYNDYYTAHCKLLEQQIQEGEKAGKTFICMAHSYIPALNARMSEGFLPSPIARIPRRPRLLIVDSTKVGSTTATGQIKKRLLGDWPVDDVMQLLPPHGNVAWVMPLDPKSPVRPLATDGDLLARVRSFRPEVIYYRPLEQHPCLENAVRLLLRELKLPLVSHIMDDWPATVTARDPARGEALEKNLRELLKRSYRALSISEKMSATFGERYGVEFEAIANGVDPADCKRLMEEAEPLKRGRREIIMRYTGALAKNMTFDTILRIARVVDRLQEDLPIRFEVYTMTPWRKAFEAAGKGLRGLTIFDSVPDEHYGRLLAEADILILGYNFDTDSHTYIRYSLPNKLPEYLGSGVPVLAVGPSETAAMELLQSNNLAVCVTTENDTTLTKAIRELVGNTTVRRQLAKRAQEWTFAHRDIHMTSSRFTTILTDAAASSTENMKSRSREDRVQVDETAVVAELLGERRGAAHIMLDVGAHFGTSAAYFDKLGWAIHCFEPDPSNRQKLIKRFGSNTSVTIDPRAVSDIPAAGVSFFQSEESTGISGLHAFRETHHESGKVDVTTVADIVEKKQITKVDFLKIDVEGFDFNVLKGVPWGAIKPDVIECEYEDAKTVAMGHKWQDIADYLRERGYAVYVSEWHPIIRYGIGHDWRRVVPYPGPEVPSDSWGNLLAFREDPGYAAVQSAFEKLLKKRPEKKPVPDKPQVSSVSATVSAAAKMKAVPDKPQVPSASAAVSAAVKKPEFAPPLPAAKPQPVKAAVLPFPETHRPFYADFGERLMWRSPRLFRVLQRSRRAAVRFPAWLKAKAPPLFRLGQVVGWLFQAAWRHKISAVVLLAVCAALVAAPFYDARLWAWHHGLWEIAAALLVAAAAGVILRETVRRLAGTNETAVAKAARSARQASERRSGELEKRLGAFAAEAQRRADASEAESRKGTEILRSEIARLTAELSVTAGNAGGRETELRAELRRIAEALNVRDEALRADFQSLRKGIIHQLHAEVEAYAGKLAAGTERNPAESNEDELRAEFRRIDEALDTREEALRSDFQTLRQAIDQRLYVKFEEHATRTGRNPAESNEDELRAEFRRITEALDTREEALRADFQALRQGIDQRLHAEIEEHATGFEAALRGQFDELRKASEMQGKRLAGFETALGKAQSQAVSLDVVSALRAMRPLWLGGSAVDTLKQQPEIEHGHALLMAVLADEARGNPNWLDGKTLIEIGSTRERDAAQGSTEKLAIFTSMTGMRFVTVDMDSQNTGRAKQILRHLNPAGQAITAKGEDYLALHAGPLDVVYLDAFDFDHGHHSEERQERYRAVLHTDINDDACWRMHLACAETLAARMPEGGIVALDDTWIDGDGIYVGKGKLAMPFLLDNGFEIIARTRMTVALRRAVKGKAKKAKAAAGGRKKRAV